MIGTRQIIALLCAFAVSPTLAQAYKTEIPTAIMTPDTIEFNTRGTMVTSPRPLYVYLTDQYAENVHSFSVWPSGQVHEEY
jgi:hypothetical protein